MSPEFESLLEQSLQPAPFIHDPLAETSGNARRPIINGAKDKAELHPQRRGTPDSLDEILGLASESGDAEDFVVDDDGAGYALGLNDYGKRTSGHLDDIDDYSSKRRAAYPAWQPRIHHAFQPSSTPWRGNRRYLCKYSLIKRLLPLMYGRPQPYRVRMDR